MNFVVVKSGLQQNKFFVDIFNMNKTLGGRAMTVKQGLDNILNGNNSGIEYLTFEEGKAKTLLFIDWYDSVMSVREHYEKNLYPKYIRCPGKDVCPLCKNNSRSSERVKFRVYDPDDGKVKVVSLAKSHVQSIHNDFTIDDIDPTKEFVMILRTGKGASDTKYTARRAREQREFPNLEELEMPNLMDVIQPHTPEQIQQFMESFVNSVMGEEAEEGEKIPTRNFPF